jgi:paxillin
MTSPSPTYMSREQVGQQPSISSLPHAYSPLKSSPLKSLSSSSFVSSPPGSSIPDSHNVWTAEYLTDLRTNRVPRPGGARPLPSPAGVNRNAMATPPPDFIPSMRVPTMASRTPGPANNAQWANAAGPIRPPSANSHRRAQSIASVNTTNTSFTGRPLVQQPYPAVTSREVLPSTDSLELRPGMVYIENGSRWMERQEARSLREALEDMDFLEEEARLHAAAQDEAAELVWQHQNPGVPYRNPDAPYNYRQHLEKGSHARSHSLGRYSSLSNSSVHRRSQEYVSSGSVSGNSGNNSGQSSRVSSGSSGTFPGQPAGNKPVEEEPPEASRGRKAHALWDSPEKKAYMNLTHPAPNSNSNTRRKSTGSRSRVISGEGTNLFRNPEDQIYEEPEEELGDPGNDLGGKPVVPAPLRPKARNHLPQHAQDPPTRTNTVPVHLSTSSSKYDIHKNPPSQSRNPGYIVNHLPPTPPNSAGASDSDTSPTSETIAMRNGVEIRGEDIRKATSMRLKDRSPKLPTPTVVSDKPGRPIVSFEADWKPKEVELKQEESRRALLSESATPSICLTKAIDSTAPPQAKAAPDTPSIHVNDSSSIPAIHVPDVPSISIAAPTATETPAQLEPSKRPLPKPKSNPFSRPLPRSSVSAPTSASTPHYSLSSRRPTASCKQCQLPIAGRIVSAAGQRFHPECFSCFHCGEGLECVAFYPEPEAKRSERLDRIAKRAQGIDIPDVVGQGIAEDGDDNLRFYCHLDFHELFSPRCRNCKTPIEGEIVVACGGEWHVGHFFCAECGDVSLICAARLSASSC